MKKAPEIRFNGFTDDWELREIGELIAEYKETVGSDCKLPVLTSSKTAGVILQEEHFGRKQNHDITGYNVLPRNYCTYRNRSDGVDFTFNINKCCDKGIISKFYPVFTSSNSDINFISLVLNNSNAVVHEIAYTATGTGQKVLSFLDLQKMKIKVPLLKEQEKISRLFSMLDDLVCLQQRKHDKLKQFKEAMLGRMFPENGAEAPEIRFAGFTDKWEQRTIGEITSTAPFKPYLKEISGNGAYEVIQQGENPVIGYADGKPFTDYEKVTLFGDHTLSIYKARSPFFVASDGVKILYSDGMDGDFYYYLLERYKPDSEGYKRHFSILKECNCRYPVSVDEQKAVSSYFRSLDSVISIHQRKLDKLNQFKQSMIDKILI